MRWISKIAALFFIVLILFSVGKNSILLAIYKADTALFVSLFCENKDRPRLKCNGKCRLAQMAKEQEQKDASDALARAHSETVLYCPLTNMPLNNELEMAVSNTACNAYYEAPYSFLYTSKTIKPPQVS